MPSNKEKAHQLINEMRKAHKIPEQSSIDEPKDFTDVRNQVSQTILDYLNELEKNLDQDDEETLSQKLGSLRILSLTIAGYELLNGGLKLMHKVNEFFTGNDRADYELLVGLGKNVIETAKNFNALLDDSSKNLGEKVWLTMKAYGKAVVSGVVGLLAGIQHGFNKGEGLIDTVSSMGQTSVAEGWAGFYKRFSDELARSTWKATMANGREQSEQQPIKNDSDELTQYQTLTCSE
ncbi:hypothetical protein LEAN103870_13975 [Legionella anisa]|uniref:Type IV secretion protein Dot n=1 Tax=Legionella anisa TaxID=28082 RepID=A0AAX0WSH2_9GAMM|nr:hypothetical protein [Legionella anisa]AWN74696.1 hypothetical protein DLD14_13095 [Legionella anisa]KTC77492.1 hypothetical protein Lani_0050 [Legionella anisa]MBN5935895.1 hypothetical protein [Legionella anisa]MCW8425183.1 hypothetical protein [Legionella anisa]MCW8449395.1 hypothetical protein [Legionella anisa]